MAVVGIIVLCVLLIVVVLRRIIKPIKEIDNVAQKISQGSLNQEITYHSTELACSVELWDKICPVAATCSALLVTFIDVPSIFLIVPVRESEIFTWK